MIYRRSEPSLTQAIPDAASGWFPPAPSIYLTCQCLESARYGAAQRMLRTPVAFFIFNRPDTTATVFAAIAKARPSTLLVVADGPRAFRRGEEQLCEAARAIIDRVDWPCRVLTNFSNHNLGCRRRISGGIDWVFSQVEEAIFLEDDCLPDPTFFAFCEEMLGRYRTDSRVMHIGGTNFQGAARAGEESYYFSRHVHVWGWASWRRAWRHYDVDMGAWVWARDADRVSDILSTPAERQAFTPLFDRVARHEIDTWDAQWTVACRAQNGLSIVPARNLVSNIGFRSDATHTSDPGHPVATMRTVPLSLPLTHPAYVLADSAADERTTAVFRPSLYRRARSFAFRVLHAVRRTRSAPGRSAADLVSATRRGAELSHAAASPADAE
jgi:hypothetical protein